MSYVQCDQACFSCSLCPRSHSLPAPSVPSNRSHVPRAPTLLAPLLSPPPGGSLHSAVAPPATLRPQPLLLAPCPRVGRVGRVGPACPRAAPIQSIRLFATPSGDRGGWRGSGGGRVVLRLRKIVALREVGNFSHREEMGRKSGGFFPLKPAEPRSLGFPPKTHCCRGSPGRRLHRGNNKSGPADLWAPGDDGLR